MNHWTYNDSEEQFDDEERFLSPDSERVYFPILAALVLTFLASMWLVTLKINQERARGENLMTQIEAVR